MAAVVLRRFGGPGALRVEQVDEPRCPRGASLVDVSLAGINFDDLEHRRGADPGLPLPAVLGVEVVGRRRWDGRRVVALLRRGGGYARVAAAVDAHCVPVPDDLDDAQAVALFEQGATAYGALRLAGRLRAGESVAVTSAAGGVGHLAVQLAVAMGAKPVVGIASTAAKRAVVAELGADVVLAPEQIGELRAVTGGRGADLVVDGTGGDQARGALRGLAPFGRLVSYGWRGGAPGCGWVDVGTEELVDGSVGVAGFWMRHVVDDRALLTGIADALFDLARAGALTARIDRVVPLAGVGAAHAAFAARQTVGKVLVDVREVG
ncbi:zinc-binding dehydrogenase [Saccharothrix sp. BKS2]|uniref:quinone oxidoreductase family protein n=1 Tax=Saccharothrix sp. BKS2 TaxID=3064400 RepID=UPI0039EC7A84